MNLDYLAKRPHTCASLLRLRPACHSSCSQCKARRYDDGSDTTLAGS